MPAEIDPDAILASYRATVAATEHGGGVEDFATLAAWLPALCGDVARLRGRVATLTEALEPFVAGWEGEVAAIFASSPPDFRVNGPPDGVTVAMMDAACRALAATDDTGRRERERAVIAAAQQYATVVRAALSGDPYSPSVTDARAGIVEAVDALAAAPDGAGMPERGASGEDGD